MTRNVWSTFSVGDTLHLIVTPTLILVITFEINKFTQSTSSHVVGNCIYCPSWYANIYNPSGRGYYNTNDEPKLVEMDLIGT